METTTNRAEQGRAGRGRRQGRVASHTTREREEAGAAETTARSASDPAPPPPPTGKWNQQQTPPRDHAIHQDLPPATVPTGQRKMCCAALRWCVGRFFKTGQHAIQFKTQKQNETTGDLTIPSPAGARVGCFLCAETNVNQHSITQRTHHSNKYKQKNNHR